MQNQEVGDDLINRQLPFSLLPEKFTFKWGGYKRLTVKAGEKRILEESGSQLYGSLTRTGCSGWP